MTQSDTNSRRKVGIKSDKIKDYYSLIVNLENSEEYKQCGVALRQSGGIDFYFDFRLVETSETIPNER